MKRLILITALLLGGAVNAHADNDIYNNALQPRGDDALHADTADCDAQLGAPHWKKVVQDFEAKYGIKVGEFDARASEMNERIRVEQTSDHFVADVEFHGDSSIIQQRQTNFIDKLGDNTIC